MKPDLRAIQGFFFVVLILAATSSCANLEATKLSRASDRIHSLFKETKFLDIYREASPFLHSRMSEAEFVSQLRETQTRVGEIQAIKKNTVPMPPPVAGAAENERMIVYDVTGAKSDCLEIITYFLENDEPKLVGYDCSYTLK